MEIIEKIKREIIEGDKEAKSRCKEILDSRMKPKGSLGILEKLAIKIAGITGKEINSMERGYHIIFSADNGIAERGISSCPIEYTRIVSEAMLNRIAAIGIMCDTLNIPYTVIDVGISGDIKREYNNLEIRKISRGSKDFIEEPAMSEEELEEAIKIGIEAIEKRLEYDFFSNGEMGIGNTTTSSAILYALTGEDIDKVVGKGGGLTDKALEHKKNIIRRGVEKYNLFKGDPLKILQMVGGFDIACMVGMYLGGAKYRKPVLIDGFISAVGALVAVSIDERVKDYIIPTHLSEEPGMKVIMERLGMEPFLNMNMRLGEGTGAVLGYDILKIAVKIPKIMKTEGEVYQILK